MELTKQRWKLTIEYDGTDYVGFQKQPKSVGKTVEICLMEALLKLSGEEIEVVVSGRTDAGVHANGQVIHFDLGREFLPLKLALGLNSFLAKEKIAVLRCEKVGKNFHARFGSQMRHYRYVVVNRSANLTLQKNRAWRVTKKLDVVVMQEATNYLVGTHDFSAFRDAECQAKSPIRSVSKIEITQQGEEIFFDVSAKSFLHHMVRNIVGTLVWIGLGKMKAEGMKEILASKDRKKSGPNAPACGLYFARVDY